MSCVEIYKIKKSDSEYIGQGWDLFCSDVISEVDNIVLGSTLDNVLVRKEYIPRVIEAVNNRRLYKSVKKTETE